MTIDQQGQADRQHKPLPPGLAAAVTFGLEHPQHAVGDEKAADDVGGGAGHGDEAEERAEPVVLLAGDNQRADQRDAGKGVGRRHQRRVQQRRHARDDVKAEKAGQDENVQAKFNFRCS